MTDGPHDGHLVEPAGSPPRLRFERRYEFGVADVWDAITDPERTGRWAFSTTFEAAAGGAVRIDLGAHGVAEGTVLAWDEHRVLEYEWIEPSASGDGAPETWRIRYELRPDGDGATVLVFDHFLPEPRRPEFAAGWHWYLDRLGALLAGAPPAAVETDAAFDRLLVHYRG